MRYLPNVTGAAKAYDEPWRPALNKMPKALADKLRERDRIKAQRSGAQTRVNELGADQMVAAAKRADDEAAAAAARAGKPIPAPAALPKLEADRADAARALAAQHAAFLSIDSETETVAADLWWSSLEKRAAERATIRDEIAAKAAELADAVEAAVDTFAVSDWLHTGIYDRSARTWPTEVVALDCHGLTREQTVPVAVRDVIAAAALSVLEDPTD